MALFPKCTFEVLLANGALVPGTRVAGTLVIDAPEPIPRAEHVDIAFSSVAWAGYGGGKNRTVHERTMFRVPLQLGLTADPMPAGRHEVPFAIDVPAWLPPGYVGNDCGIRHQIETRLDVNWAVDPVARFAPTVQLVPRRGTRAALLTRSPPSFHETLVLEVTLASTVIAHDEPLVGQVAIRSGHDARFDAVDLELASSALITMSLGDRRRGASSKIRIPADLLRGGEPVSFEFPPNQPFPPSFLTWFIDHEVILSVSADVPWASDPSFDLLLDVLPAGSTLDGDPGRGLVGSERLRRIAAAMAESTGLREGRAPVLVEGTVAGPIDVRISDAPRLTQLGLDVDIEFPDVELGISFHPRGFLDRFHESRFLPRSALLRSLADRYVLTCEGRDERVPVDEASFDTFVHTLLADLADDDEVRFSDHHLGVHLSVPNDELPRLVEIARAAQAKAKVIAGAIGALPFPASVAAARPAWLATASEQSAFLVPTGPSLHGLTFRARVLAGEERVIGASLRTRWTKDGPTLHVDVDLRNARLPEAARAELESETPSERLKAVRAWFPSAHVLADGNGATLDRPEWTEDPRSVLSAIEMFFWWVLDARGERRSDLPYR